jgi:hypothetical protein
MQQDKRVPRKLLVPDAVAWQTRTTVNIRHELPSIQERLRTPFLAHPIAGRVRTNLLALRVSVAR